MELEDIYDQSGKWHLKARGDTPRYSYTFLNSYFSKKRCSEIVKTTESDIELISGYTLSKERTEDVRECSVGWVKMNDAHSPLYRDITDAVLSINNQFWNFNLSYIEDMQYTVYDSSVWNNPRYDWHQDEGFTRSWCNEIRKLSFICLLSDPRDFTGGELQYYADNETRLIPLQQGDVVFFPSPTLHRVTTVTKGIRKTLVGWVRGPGWT